MAAFTPSTPMGVRHVPTIEKSHYSGNGAATTSWTKPSTLVTATSTGPMFMNLRNTSPDGRPSRRAFLALSSTAALTALLPHPLSPLSPLAAALAATEAAPFELPPLPYAYEALEPHISAQIMRAHHDGHFAAYVEKLNLALAKLPGAPPRTDGELVKLLATLDTAIGDKAVRTAVRNNGGGYINHKLFFSQMAGKPRALPADTALAQAIARKYGSFDAFQTEFLGKATTLFGSGFTWLVRTGRNDIDIVQTANQDNPVMSGMTPILGCDCWEHAWYYQYGPAKKQYLVAWWKVVDWPVVNDVFTSTATS